MGNKGNRRRQELLRIAYRLFMEKGYDNTTIEEIIREAGIAKGTYYYHFPSKEATLEAVIEMMISEEAEKARQVIASPMPVPQKLAGVIYALRPAQNEQNIANALEARNNIVLHDRLNKCLISVAVPLVAEIVREGIGQGIFACEHIEERVKMILILCSEMFDDGNYTENDVIVFIDMVEKTVGAEPGTMAFIKELIR